VNGFFSQTVVIVLIVIFCLGVIGTFINERDKES